MSYAANHEDVIIARALSDVDRGFYVHVGAGHPTIGSATKAFYDRGWSGINIEPQVTLFQLLERDRVRDVNLAVSLGAAEGQTPLFEVPEHREWTTTDPASADRLRASGHTIVARQSPLRTLDGILANYISGPIHFLKISVGGAEKQVLSGIDFSKWRPWIVLLESITAHDLIDRSTEWEAMILGHHYNFVYFDGLHRLYVAQEQATLADSLGLQPNIFDKFTSYAEWLGHQETHHLQTQLLQQRRTLEATIRTTTIQAEKANAAMMHRYHALSATNEQLNRRILELDRDLLFLQGTIDRLDNRMLIKLDRWLRKSIFKLIKRSLRRVAGPLYRLLRRLPGMTSVVSKMVSRFPKVKSRLQSVISGPNTTVNQGTPPDVMNEDKSFLNTTYSYRQASARIKG